MFNALPMQRNPLGQAPAHTSSRIGSPSGNIGIGLPEWSVKLMSLYGMSRWCITVAHRSLGTSGLSLGVSALEVVDPTTWPILRPPAEIGSDIAGIEARLASHAAELAAGLAGWKEAMSAKVSKLPWWAGAWKVAGPFSRHKEDPHTVSFRPEGANEPDAAGKPDPVRWKVRDDLTEIGRAHV